MSDQAPLRVLAWGELDDDTREQLLGRGVTAIFDPKLRESVALILDDVRENGFLDEEPGLGGARGHSWIVYLMSGSFL